MVGHILGNIIDSATNIYRICTKERLFQLYDTNQNALVRPKLWDDTFENLALNSEIDLNGETGYFDFRNDVYCQCWTRHTVSDAMWRLYSEGTNGVRIRTTVGKLLASLADSNLKSSGYSCFIGKVDYYKDKELNEFADNHFQYGLGSDGKNIAETLLVKRTAFRHENEVRLIYLSPNPSLAKRDLYFYDVNPHNLIDQIMVHPQLAKSDAAALKTEIEERTGYTGEIKRSLLYRLPNGFKFKVNA